MRTRRFRRAAIPRSAFAGFGFPPDVIVLAVRWYLRYGLSYRDLEVITGRAPADPLVLEELLPAAWHRPGRYANNHVEADHGRLKARLRPMRGLRQGRSARVVISGHAFVQNLRRGHYELAVEEPANRRLAVAFDELALAI
jgi:transposase-like protein